MSNTDSIYINFEAGEEDALQIENAAAFFQATSLNPDDEDTTLTANVNLHSEFKAAQDLFESLGKAMNQEAINIRSTGVAFEEYDRMAADLLER